MDSLQDTTDNPGTLSRTSNHTLHHTFPRWATTIQIGMFLLIINHHHLLQAPLDLDGTSNGIVKMIGMMKMTGMIGMMKVTGTTMMTGEEVFIN